MAGSILTTDNGLIRFYDGTIIAIEMQEYSADGTTNWEETFNPNDHISTLDGVTNLEGHKYKRVKHSEDTDFQLPYKIVAETPEFRVNGYNFEWKFEDETTWTLLLDLETLKGDTGNQGDKGIPGEGFHIDGYGFYQTRPTSSSEGTTFMSLGDGTLKLTTALIGAGTVTVDLVAYSHFSNDLITWTALTAGILDFQARYLATDGTGAVYTDMQTEDYYGSRGVVYLYSQGVWTVNQNVATPSYQVGEASLSSNIGYLDNFVLTSANNLAGTISIDAGKLEVIEQSITEDALNQTVAGDGLDIPSPMDPIEIEAEDFAGFGLATYASVADSEVDIQVNMANLVTDGLGTAAAGTVDGETRTQAYVDVTDIINTASFLVAGANPVPDGFNDLTVNIGYGLVSDSGGTEAITLDVDDLSLVVDVDSVRVKEFAAGNDGILPGHLNPNIIHAARGVALDSVEGLSVMVDAVTINNLGPGSLQVMDHGITGVKLNSDVVEPLKGLAYSADQLSVLVDGSSIDFNGLGQLEFTGNISTAIAASSDIVIKSLIAKDNAIVGATVHDDVTFQVNDGTGTVGNISADAPSDTLTVSVDIDEAWLTAWLISYPPAAATTSWVDITLGAGVASNTDLVDYIDSLTHTVLDTYYGTTKIKSQAPNAGIILKSVGNNEFQLIVDNNGNLDTVAV